MAQPVVEYISSTKGKNKIAVFNNFEYSKNNASALATYYVCVNVKKQCPARLIVYLDGSTKDTGNHNHPPSPEFIQARRSIEIGKKAVTDTLPTLEAMSKIEETIQHTSHLAPFLGSESSRKRKALRAKRKARGEVDMGKSRETIKIPEDLQITTNKQPFLLKDFAGPLRILIFATIEMLRILGNCDTWLVDGTFKSSPSAFVQLFAIHGVFMGATIPLVYSYLPGKQADFYAKVFDAVCATSGAIFQPKYIISDFETGIIKVIRQRACYSMDDPIRKVFAYFQNTYIGYSWDDVDFPIPFWNCYDRLMDNQPRTTNSVEGWHHRLNTIVDGAHPSMWKSLDCIRKEQRHWEQKCANLRSGELVIRRNQYIHLDKKLRSIVTHYNTPVYNTTMEYLKGLSFVIHDYKR